MREPHPTEKPPRVWPLLLVLAGFALALFYLFGSPLAAWTEAVTGVESPLLVIPLLLFLTAVVPIVVIVFLGVRKKD